MVPWDIVDALNTNFDGILVASSFVHKTLRDLGCHRPIAVMPLVLDRICR